MSDPSPNVHIEPASEPPDAGSFASEIIPAPAPSPFDGLAAKLAKVREELTIDLEVPRWPEVAGFRVFVRYAPVSPDYMSQVAERFEKSKAEDWRTMANAQILVHSCRGVYAVDPAKPEEKLALRSGDPDGSWTRFDEDLAKTLGVTEQSAIAVCRALYLTDADLGVASSRLAEWSAADSEEREKGFRTP